MRRFIALMIAGALLLSLPGAALGWAHGKDKGQPSIDLAQTYCEYAEGRSVAYIYFDTSAAKPVWVQTLWNPGNVLKISSFSLRNGYVMVQDLDPQTWIRVWLYDRKKTVDNWWDITCT